MLLGLAYYSLSLEDLEYLSGYTVRYPAASLFEFNIDDTKTEAGYPYPTSQAGEVCFRLCSTSYEGKG